MANHKSTKKRIRSTKTRQEGNKYLHKTVRNAMRGALLDSSKEGEKKAPKIISMIDRYAEKDSGNDSQYYISSFVLVFLFHINLKV